MACREQQTRMSATRVTTARTQQSNKMVGPILHYEAQVSEIENRERSVGSGRGSPPTALPLHPSRDSAHAALYCSEPGAARALSRE
eukprot:7905686-Alexandrium_andersonii.AAC.1